MRSLRSQLSTIGLLQRETTQIATNLSHLFVYQRRTLYDLLVDVCNDDRHLTCEQRRPKFAVRRKLGNIRWHHAPSPRRNRLNLGSISRRYSACLIRKSASWTLPLPLQIRFSAAGPYTDVYSSKVSSSVGTTRQPGPMTQKLDIRTV